MNTKIITPTSELFRVSKQAKAIADLSDGLELRDLPGKFKNSEVKIYHSEVSLIAKWRRNELTHIAGILKKYKRIGLITFHLLSCFEDFKRGKNLIFYPGSIKMSKRAMLENAKKNLADIKKINKKIKVAVENNNFFPTGAYEIITEPEFINWLAKKLNIGILLDLAHVKISAFNKVISQQKYANKIDLARVWQIHLSSPVIGGRCLDAHNDLKEKEWEYFRKTWRRCPNLKFVTIEYYKNQEKLIRMLLKLRQITNDK